MRALTLANLLAWSLQVACVAGVAGALPWIFRLRAPDVRHLYWRSLLALCILLPVVQGRVVVESTLAPVAPLPAPSAWTNAVTAAAATVAGTPARQIPLTSAQLIAVAIGAGILLRGLWIAAGLFYLRRLRHAGAEAPARADIAELQATLGTRAAIRIVPGLRQPVTFGVLNPVVLVPDTLDAHAADVQRAVLAHELLHVQRRDWAWILVEEVIRAVLWFHPAMWWLVSRVQLSREEVVDELSVLAIGRRRTYAEALLAFADTTPLSPAPAFARRRHLLRRLALISTEAVMSSKRIVATSAAMACVVVVGSWTAISAFPLRSIGATVAPAPAVQEQDPLISRPGPLEIRAVPITPENPIPRRLASAEPDYPAEAAARQATGLVTLRVTIDELGRVAESRAKAFTVRVEGQDAFSLSFRDLDAANVERAWEGTIKTAGGGPYSTRTLVRPLVEAFLRSSLDAIRQWRYDSPAKGPLTFDVSFKFGPPRGAEPPPPPPPPPPPGPRQLRTVAEEPAWTVDGAVRIGGAMKAPEKLKDVRPVYPPIAQSAKVSGIVIVEARIEADGRVSAARILKSIPLLDEAALDAVRQWEFTPTYLNGVATPVVMTVTVNFALQQ
jgi:TonB family protein